jgi:hypothetical protein
VADAMAHSFVILGVRIVCGARRHVGELELDQILTISLS